MHDGEGLGLLCRCIFVLEGELDLLHRTLALLLPAVPLGCLIEGAVVDQVHDEHVLLPALGYGARVHSRLVPAAHRNAEHRPF